MSFYIIIDLLTSSGTLVAYEQAHVARDSRGFRRLRMGPKSDPARRLEPLLSLQTLLHFVSKEHQSHNSTRTAPEQKTTPGNEADNQLS